MGNNLNMVVSAQDQASGVLNGIKGVVNDLGHAMTLFAGFELVSGIKAATQSLFSFQSSLEQTKIAFTSMLKSADAAGVLVNDLYRLAAETPFEFEQVQTATTRMLAFGFAAKDVMGMLTIVGDAAAAMGSGAEGIHRITRALGQMKAKGRLQGQELMQLAEAGIPAYAILAEKLKLTGEEVGRIGEKGIAADIGIKALLEGMNEKFGGMMKAQSDSWKGIISTIRDNILMLGQTLTEGPFDLIRDKLKEIRDMSNSIIAPMQQGGLQALFLSNSQRQTQQLPAANREKGDTAPAGLRDLKETTVVPEQWFAGIQKAWDHLSVFWDNCKKLVDDVGALLSKMFGGNGWDRLAGMILACANAFVVAIDVVVNIASAFVDFYNSIEPTIPLADALQAAIFGMVAGFVAFKAVNAATSILQGLAGAMMLVATPAGAVALAVGLVAAAAYLIYENWDPLVGWISGVWDNIVSVVMGPVTTLWDMFNTFFPGAYELICSAFSALGPSLGQIWEDIKTNIWSSVKDFVNGILEALGPLGKLIRGVGDSLNSAWASMKNFASGGASSSFKSWLSNIKKMSFNPLKGRDDLNNAPGSKTPDMDKKDKGGKGAKAQNSMDEMLMALEEKIIGISGTKPQEAAAKLATEITKSLEKIDEAQKLGIDTSGVFAKLQEYKALAEKKIMSDFKQVQAEFNAETLSMIAENSANKLAIADAELNSAIVKLNKEKTEWEKTGVAKEEVEKRFAAKKDELNKKWLRSTQDALLKDYDLNVQHNNNLMYLKQYGQKQIDSLSRPELTSKQKVLEGMIALETADKERRITLENQLVEVKRQLYEQDGRNMDTAAQEALRRINSTTTDYAGIIVDTWEDIKGSVYSHLDAIIDGTESFGDGLKGIFNDICSSILKMWAKMIVEMYIMAPMKDLFSKILGVPGSNNWDGKGINTAKVIANPTSGNMAPGTYATGGVASGWSIVGEEGPELANFGNPARIYTASQTKSMLGSLGGQSSQPSSSRVVSPSVRIELINQTGSNASAKQQSSFDSEKNEMVISIVLEALENNSMGLREAVGRL